MPVLTCAFPARSRSVARAKPSLALAAALLLAGACSRSPGRATPAAAGDGPSPPVSTAEAHLTRGEEALERREYPLAKEELAKSSALFEKDQNWDGYVRARNRIGMVASGQGDYKVALEHLNAALSAAREKLAPGHLEVARSQQGIGMVYVSTGRPAEGLELLRKALALQRTAGAQPREVVKTLMRMGSAHLAQGDDEQALVVLDEAETIGRATPGRPYLADVLIVKGSAYWGQGDYDRAIEVLERAIAMLNADVGPGSSLGAAYSNLGNAYWSKSDYDEALTFYEKALPLQIAALGESHPNVGMAHFNLAILHLMKEDYDASIASAERALTIFLPLFGERHSLVVQTNNALGSALTGKGDPDRALGVLTKALAIQLSLSETGDRDSALVYASLADAYRAKGDLVRAVRHHRRALAIDLSIYGGRHPDVAEDLVNLGEVYLEKGDEEQALAFFVRAIAANDPQRAGADLDLDPPLDTAFSEEFLLKALSGAAKSRARRGAERKRPWDVEQAALVYEHASRLIDRMRAGYRAEGSKLSIAADAKETYEEAIRTELELHRLTGGEHLEAAFRYVEMSKAGILRDALNEAEARAFAGIPAPLLERDRKLRIDLAAVERRLTEARLEAGADKDALQGLRDERFTLKREYDALLQRFEKVYPAYYDLKYRFDTAGTEEVRERTLDERTVLVEYFLGKERVFIFTIAQQGLEVASVAREPSLEAELSELRRAIVDRDVASYTRTAHSLYRLLLAPVEGRLAGKDLVIVPDGPLSTVPFEALLKREASPDADPRDLPYVLRGHAVSYAYSATVLVQGLDRKNEIPPDELIAFAPLFAQGADPPAEAPRPLPASRKEVTDVRRLVAKRQGLFGGWLSGRSRVHLGEDATEARLKSAGLERYRYVHLATHGIVDEEHPGLSRLLFLPEAGSGEDGVLHLGEVYNLRLNADLVVLSACDTGRGRIARGEGIMGLTRGFLYAGARSLLVSLWPVSDAAASALVVDFYEELLAGRPKAHALREAKLRTMGRNPEYAKPYYWSALVLVGEQR